MVNRSHCALAVAIVSVLGGASTAAAETLAYGVDAGVAETDNVTLVPTNKVSQTIAVADADFDIRQQTRLLDLDARGNFSYQDYLQNAFKSQLTGRFDGNGKFSIIPEKLSWVVQDDFGQSTVDPFTPTTPNNLEDVNYFSTGPDWLMHFGGASYLNASARYSRVQYETSPFNSNRLQGSLGGGLQLSSASSVSLNVNTERVMFENTQLNTDFERTDAFGRYEINGARTTLSAELGATSVTQAGQSNTGGLLRFELSRKMSTAATLKLSLGRDLTDGSSSFSNLQGGAVGIVGAAPAPQTSNSYTSNYAMATWEYVRNRTTVRLSARWEKDLYGGAATLDNTRDGAEFLVDRRLTRALSAQVLGRYYKTDYEHALISPTLGSTDYEDETLGASLTWRHGRGLEVRLRGEHSARVTSQGDTGYRENRVLLTVGYRPAVAGSAQPSSLE